jgi:hypothetical protein
MDGDNRVRPITFAVTRNEGDVIELAGQPSEPPPREVLP